MQSIIFRYYLVNMSNIDFLKRLGVYIDVSYLDKDTCKNIIKEGTSGKYLQAEVSDESLDKLDEEIRKTKVLEMSQATKDAIEDKLLACKLRLEKHFALSLNSCQNPQLLQYKKGDFFIPHADTNDLPSTEKYIRDRQISVVIFLNDGNQSPGENEYAGGSLDLYGLIQNDPKWEKYGFPINGKAGLLVAFPSHIIHEVKPVIAGERYTIVTWFV
jgi:SM-20-related protein